MRNLEELAREVDFPFAGRRRYQGPVRSPYRGNKRPCVSSPRKLVGLKAVDLTAVCRYDKRGIPCQKDPYWSLTEVMTANAQIPPGTHICTPCRRVSIHDMIRSRPSFVFSQKK